MANTGGGLEWGHRGISRAGWIVNSMRHRAVHTLIVDHNPECDVDHGSCRFWILNLKAPGVQDTRRRLVGMGYKSYPSECDFADYVGADKVLDLLLGPLSESLPPWHIALYYGGGDATVDEILDEEADAGLAGVDVPPGAIACGCGPIPVPDGVKPDVVPWA